MSEYENIASRISPSDSAHWRGLSHLCFASEYETSGDGQAHYISIYLPVSLVVSQVLDSELTLILLLPINSTSLDHITSRPHVLVASTNHHRTQIYLRSILDINYRHWFPQ